MVSARKPLRYLFSQQSGQGIIEIVVVLALAAILILALVALSVRSNRSSTFAKAEDQASRLAQQGIEAIENVRAGENVDPGLQPLQLANDCTGGGSTISWDQFYNDPAHNDAPDYCNAADYPAAWREINPELGRVGWFHHVSFGPSNNACNTVNENWCVHFSNDGDTYSAVTIGNRVFHRTVYVADTPRPAGKSDCNTTPGDFNVIKQFSVVVSWEDSSGRHESIVTKCISR